MPDSMLYPRFATRRIAAALRDTPVVMINGPRQCGKTTLVRQLISGTRTYVTLDDETTLAAASGDPSGFIRGLDRAIIDEVQRAPAVLRAIKQSVDNDRRPGRFLLTGSANMLTLPRVSDSLAGRMETITLLPLSQAEILGHPSTFLKAAFAGRIVKPRTLNVADALVRTVLTGGYPQMLLRKDPRRRRAWAREYLNAIIQKDVRDIVDAERLQQMPRLFQTLAHHAGQLVNFTQTGARVDLDDKTTRKYVGLLEQLFLVRHLSPWFRNRLKRLVKTSKLHFLDSGLLALTLRATPQRIATDRSVLGPLLESFVFAEILKQTTLMEDPCSLYYYRDKDKDEVDIVVEDGGGRLLGIEVKTAASVSSSDFRGLRKLAAAGGKDFTLGMVLYDGERTVPFGDKLYAAPVSCLWA